MGDVIAWRLIEFAVTVEDAAPSIVVCIDRSAKSDDDLLCTRELCHELSAYALELRCINLAMSSCHVESLRLDAEHLLSILLVSKDHVAAGNEFRHHL